MEVENGHRNMASIMIVEFFSTLIFTLAYNLDDGSHTPQLVWFILFTMTWRVTGGNANPAISLGVYIERKQYNQRHSCMLLLLWFCQFLGALGALGVGLILRTSLPQPEDPSKYYFVPGQYPFYPQVIDDSMGLPMYGQVWLAECLGAILLVLFTLFVKKDLADDNLNPMLAGVGLAIALVVISQIFNKVSGGIFNPAVSLAQIVWQQLTYQYEKGEDQTYWTVEYAVSYCIAPFFGAFVSGNIYNYLERKEQRRLAGLDRYDTSDDSDTMRWKNEMHNRDEQDYKTQATDANDENKGDNTPGDPREGSQGSLGKSEKGSAYDRQGTGKSAKWYQPNYRNTNGSKYQRRESTPTGNDNQSQRSDNRRSRQQEYVQ